MTEAADVVVVGGRIAGCATAISLARADRRVIVLERGRADSNSLSTHGLWPGGVAELNKLGALDRVLALDPPRVRWYLIHHLGYTIKQLLRPVDGFDYVICVPRPQLDTALVETAREAGAEVREQTKVTDLLWAGDRVAGVRCAPTGGGESIEIRAKLVVGADGRRSTVAELVGEATPYRGSKNYRGFAYWYMDDPHAGTQWRHTLPLWRVGTTAALVLPMPQDRMCVALMGPVADLPKFRADPAAQWEQVLRESRHLAARVAGATNASRMFLAPDLTAFFRRSSGPGWALAGDAGHFKDPVLAQGMRDAMEFGRRLGECVAPLLDSPADLDLALRDWEHTRDRACLPMYHFANRETCITAEQPAIVEAFRMFARQGETSEMGEMFSRVMRPDQLLTPGRGIRWLTSALTRPGADRRLILSQFRHDVPIDIATGIERMRDRFRSAGLHPSENPGWEWPPRRAGDDAGSEPSTDPALEATAA
jgi:2-polyprenyl-6-methoxyphenol hydroxylase-like FAD-dependent oxidoreductase